MKNKLNFSKKNTQYLYITSCLFLSFLSILSLLSIENTGRIVSTSIFGNYKIVVTQIFAIALGILCAIFLARINFNKIVELWPYISLVCWGFVFLTFIPGIAYAPSDTGSKSWIATPLGMSIQPTEFAKIAFFIDFSVHLNHVKRNLSKPKTLFFLVLHILLPVLIIHLQGDDGTATIFFATGVIMLFIAGLNRWLVITCGVLGFASLPFLWNYILSDHQKNRILGMILPENFANTTMYQQLLSRSAIESGGLFGKGFFSRNQTYVPREENDFIFSYLAQCLGFVGTVLILLVLFAFLLKTLHFSAANTNQTAAYFCGCVFACLFFQTCIHIGMNLMISPVMGLTLPFLSAGGSSVLMVYLAVGIVLSAQKNSYSRTLSNNYN